MAQHRQSQALLQGRVASLASQYQAHVAEKKGAKAKIKDWTKAFKAEHGGCDPGTEDKMRVQHLYTDYKAWDARINSVKGEMVAAKASVEDGARSGTVLPQRLAHGRHAGARQARRYTADTQVRTCGAWSCWQYQCTGCACAVLL